MKTDVVVIGKGPAGIQASIHAARKKAGVVMLGRTEKSALRYANVENYCCSQEAQEDAKMLKDGITQAKNAGALLLEEDAVSVEKAADGFRIMLESGAEIHVKSVVLALGVSRNKANVKGEDEYRGHGVSYCVECDAHFFRGKAVAVLGDGSAAVSGAELMAKYAEKTVLVTRKPAVSPVVIDRARSAGAIVREGAWIREIKGRDGNVSSVVYEDGTEEGFDGVFIELGARGAMELAVGMGVGLDPESFRYIETDKEQATSVPGVYAAGDICGAPFQMAKAVGEGCVAGTNAADFAKQAGTSAGAWA